MAEENLGKKISELDDYQGGLQKAMDDNAVFPVAAKASNFKIFLKDIATFVLNKIQAACEPIIAALNEEIGRSQKEDARHSGLIADLLLNKQNILPAETDPMKLLKSNLTWTIGRVDFVYELTGDYSEIPVPSGWKNGYLVFKSQDGKRCMILCLIGCGGDMHFWMTYIAASRENGNSGKFYIPFKEYWRTVIDASRLNELANRIGALESKPDTPAASVGGKELKDSFKNWLTDCLNTTAHILALLENGQNQAAQNYINVLRTRITELPD